jgi:hypothetical protein
MCQVLMNGAPGQAAHRSELPTRPEPGTWVAQEAGELTNGRRLDEPNETLECADV